MPETIRHGNIDWFREPFGCGRRANRPGKGIMTSRLYIGNLSYQTTVESLRATFETGGRTVKDATIITDRETGQSRGFGFIEMGTAEEAAAALAELDGQDLDGRQLRISEARERAARGPGGPGAGPGGPPPRRGPGGPPPRSAGGPPRGGFGGPPRGGFGGPPPPMEPDMMGGAPPDEFGKGKGRRERDRKRSSSKRRGGGRDRGGGDHDEF